jgi:hypothetical protein
MSAIMMTSATMGMMGVTMVETVVVVLVVVVVVVMVMVVVVVEVVVVLVVVVVVVVVMVVVVEEVVEVVVVVVHVVEVVEVVEVVVVNLLGYSNVGTGERNVPASRYGELQDRHGLQPCGNFPGRVNVPSGGIYQAQQEGNIALTRNNLKRKVDEVAQWQQQTTKQITINII